MQTLLKIQVVLMAVGLVLGVSENAPAGTIVVGDSYWGADDHGRGDRIGDSRFEVHGASVSRSASSFSVDIATSFANSSAVGSYSRYTAGRRGIGYGDLFLASKLSQATVHPTDPRLTDAVHYRYDDHANGTIWSYAFSFINAPDDDLFSSPLNDRWSSSASEGSRGQFSIYALESRDNGLDTLLSDDFMMGAVYRDGQEVAVNVASTGVKQVGTGNWQVTDGHLLFTTDLAKLTDSGLTSLLSGSELALHWGMTCANDTYEARFEVPEPGTATLLVFGLLGLSLTRRRAKHSRHGHCV